MATADQIREIPREDIDMNPDPDTIDDPIAAILAAEERWTRANAAYVAANTDRIRIGEELRAQGRDYLDGIPAFDAAAHAVDVAEQAATQAFAEWRELEDTYTERLRWMGYMVEYGAARAGPRLPGRGAR